MGAPVTQIEKTGRTKSDAFMVNFGADRRGHGPYRKCCIKRWIKSFKWTCRVESVFGTSVYGSPDESGKGLEWKFKPFDDTMAFSDSELIDFECQNCGKIQGPRGVFGCVRLLY